RTGTVLLREPLGILEVAPAGHRSRHARRCGEHTGRDGTRGEEITYQGGDAQGARTYGTRRHDAAAREPAEVHAGLEEVAGLRRCAQMTDHRRALTRSGEVISARFPYALHRIRHGVGHEDAVGGQPAGAHLSPQAIPGMTSHRRIPSIGVAISLRGETGRTLQDPMLNLARHRTHSPRSPAMSIFFIASIRWWAPGASMIRSMSSGTICQLTPYSSQHQPHASFS